ncbi:MAG: RraA family protein [Rhizobiaceae bacterium]
MIEEPPLLTVKQTRKRPSQAQIDAFQNVATGFVVDALYGGGALSGDIQPVGGGRDITTSVAGPALTADSGPADVLATIAALNFIEKGDVLVSAFGGHQGCAAAGDRIMGMLGNCGGIGLVTDGPVRDYQGIVEVGLPIWCTGLTPASPFTSGPGRIGFAIQIGGQQVESGDMVIADRDGVVVVPFDQIDAAIENLQRVQQAEEARDQKVAEGLKLPADIEQLLQGDQTRFVD